MILHALNELKRPNMPRGEILNFPVQGED